MAIHFSKETKKACEKAFELVQSHFWGDRTNAGKNYKRGKNKVKNNEESK